MRPEDGPSPEEVAQRQAKIEAREAKLAQWDEENKASRFAVKVGRWKLEKLDPGLKAPGLKGSTL